MKETNQQKIKKTQLTYPNSLLEKKRCSAKMQRAKLMPN